MLWEGFASLFDRYSTALLDGAITTLELAMIIWLLGLVIGAPLGILRGSQSSGATKGLLQVAVLALSSVPILVYLLWAHYPLQAGLGVSVPPFLTAAVVLTLYNALTVSELVQGALKDFPVAFEMAARVNGLRRGVFAKEILAPIVFRAALPGYLGSQVAALHLTLFASLISVDELFRVAQRINSIEYNAVEVFSVLAIFYFCLSFPLLLFSKWAESRLSQIGLDR